MKRNRTQVHGKQAFTLIEVLIAIGIIVLLAGILFIAGKGVREGAADKATHVSLAALKGMFGEYDSKTRLANAPPGWRWWNLNAGAAITETARTVSGTTPMTIDFWTIPSVVPSSSPLAADAMDAPGSVMSEVVTSRNGSRQIINTQLVMTFLLAMPNNRAAIQNMTSDHYMLLQYQGGSLNAPGSDGVLYTSDDSAGTDPITYLPGNRVQYNGQRFVCLLATTSAPAAGANWQIDNGPVVPILLDGWGNPMIFVPGSGLRVRMLNGAKDYNDTTPNLVRTVIVVSPEGKVQLDPNGIAPPVVLQPGRPFWASAGPDGDFAKGDDNIYSFQP